MNRYVSTGTYNLVGFPSTTYWKVFSFIFTIGITIEAGCLLYISLDDFVFSPNASLLILNLLGISATLFYSIIVTEIIPTEDLVPLFKEGLKFYPLLFCSGIYTTEVIILLLQFRVHKNHCISQSFKNNQTGVKHVAEIVEYFGYGTIILFIILLSTTINFDSDLRQGGDEKKRSLFSKKWRHFRLLTKISVGALCLAALTSLASILPVGYSGISIQFSEEVSTYLIFVFTTMCSAANNKNLRILGIFSAAYVINSLNESEILKNAEYYHLLVFTFVALNTLGSILQSKLFTTTEIIHLGGAALLSLAVTGARAVVCCETE